MSDEAPTAIPTQLLTTRESRARLKIGQTKLYELIGSGALETVKIGTRRLIPESAIAEYVAALQRRGVADPHAPAEQRA